MACRPGGTVKSTAERGQRGHAGEPWILTALRRTGIFSSQEIVSANDAHMRDLAVTPYCFVSDYSQPASG
jgi:hypothetical protein